MGILPIPAIEDGRKMLTTLPDGVHTRHKACIVDCGRVSIREERDTPNRLYRELACGVWNRPQNQRF